MAYLFASNNIADFIGLSSDSNVLYHDSSRVPYAFTISDDNSYPMRSNHPPSSTTTTWYHWRMHSLINAGGNEDGRMWRIFDEDGNFLHEVDILNGAHKPGVSGDGTTFSYGSSTAPYSSNALYEIDIMVDVTPSDVTVEWYIDQVLHGAGIITTPNVSNLGKARKLELAAHDSSYNSWTPFLISEVIISETDTRGLRLNMLEPTGEGFHTDWEGAYTDINDDDIATGIKSLIANESRSFTVGAYGGGPIASVIAVSLAKKDPAGPQSLMTFLRKGGVDYIESASLLEDNTGYAIKEWPTDPSDSNPWEDADLSGIELGVRSISGITIEMEAASYILTGYDTILSLADVDVQLDAASFSLSVKTLETIPGRLVQPDAASFTLTGHDATITL